jgi:hypothetical protein
MEALKLAICRVIHGSTHTVYMAMTASSVAKR